MRLGTLIERNGHPAIQFTEFYPCSIEQVWGAVSDPAGLVHWFPSSVELERREGGTITFSGDPNIALSTGVVLTYDPPRALAFTWGGDELRIELDPADAMCRLTLTDVLENEAAAARNAAGWSICLGELAQYLNGQLTEGPHSSANNDLFHSYYDAHIAAGLPHGAAIPQ